LYLGHWIIVGIKRKRNTKNNFTGMLPSSHNWRGNSGKKLMAPKREMILTFTG